jgi:ATP-binding cassette subfamily B protein
MKNKKLRLLWQFLKGSKRYFACSILLAAVTALAEMINPQIIRAAVDNAIGGKPADFPLFILNFVEKLGGFAYLGKHLWIMALAILIVAAIRVCAQYAFRVQNTKASETLVKTMRDRLYSHIGRLPFGWHMKNRTGDIIQRCTSDIDTLKNFLSEQLTSIFRICLMLSFSIFFMLTMNPKLTLVAAAPLPLILAYSIFFRRDIAKGFLECDESEGLLSAMAQENLTGVRVVRAFGREKFEKDRFEAQNQEVTTLWEKLSWVMSRFWSVADILSGTQILLLVTFGAVFCVEGTLTSGEYLAFISYNSMLVWPIRQLGRMISELSKAGVALDRIMFITEAQQETDPAEAIAADMGGDITFDHVTFAYEEGKDILTDVSFTVPAGTTLGILGGTGSGKSTLIQLLDKLYLLPEGGGKITIGGRDIKTIETPHLRRHIAMVLQEPYLFSRTIAENITITDPNLSQEELKKAAQSACLEEAIENFAAGYDTFVGERGVTLSGGQKQRAAIARALVQKAPIMVFDDSLSAVDTETDAKIRKELEKRFGSATIFLISHRITTLSKADQIIVLEHGRIAEQGTHDQLKSAGGIYQKIYEAQSGKEAENV